MSDEIKEKIMQLVHIDHKTGCWNWKFKANKGRLVTRYEGKQVEAKSLFFSVFLGDVLLENIRYKQKCGNKKCVNPEHLNAMTHLDYMGELKKLDFCKNGHKLDEKNTSIISNKKYGTKRRCKQCDRDAATRKRKLSKNYTLNCDYCNNLFIGSLAQVKNKEKSKNIFCCIACKNKHQASKKHDAT